MDDPKNRALPPPTVPTQLIALQPEQFAALMATREDSDELLKKRAAYDAEAMERRQNPSNKTHPGKSVFSYPEGEVARPKPRLKCQMFWVGYEETADTLTPEEVTLLNQAEPGTYKFSRTDGSPDQLTIDGQRDAGGHLRMMNFHFKCRGEFRSTVPSKVAMLREALGLTTSDTDLRAEIERLRALVAQ